MERRIGNVGGRSGEMERQKENNVSKLRIMFRKSKYLWFLRTLYAVCIGINQHGIVREAQFLRDRMKGKVAKKKYYKKLLIDDKERQYQANKKYKDKVCFSILVPLYNTPKQFLKEMIESVQKQTYFDWQLCLADGSDHEHAYVRSIVKRYQQKDCRISYCKLKENNGISENTNVCIKMAKGDYLLLLDHDDILHEAALYELRDVIDKQAADFIYTDEAIFSKNIFQPDEYHFKQDFALDDLRSNNYICHITCFSRKLLQEVGGFQKEFDGSQDFDFILRLSEKANKIVHIPKVLYFWRCHTLSVASDISAKTYCIDTGKMAVEAHLKRKGIAADVCSSDIFPVIYRIKYHVIAQPKVSIIIWDDTKDSCMGKCVKSIQENTLYANYEILKCNNIKDRNQIAKSAEGEYLLFIDSRCVFRDKNWLQEMLGIAQRREVGVVGAGISYMNNIIRDAGLIIGTGSEHLAANAFYQIQSDSHVGFIEMLYFIHNVSAVTDACMMVRQSDFVQIGGFDDRLPSWYAGLDLSLKLRRMNKINIINPYSKVFFSSKERERSLTGEFKGKKKYVNMLKKRYIKELKMGDPYYNINLERNSGNYMIKWK